MAATALGYTGDVLCACAWCGYGAALVLAWRGDGRALRLADAGYLGVIVANALLALSGVLLRHWGQAAVNASIAALLGWLWWRNRRKDRKRALAALGYKALVAKAALVRKAREAAKPRPVLRPVPGGVR